MFTFITLIIAVIIGMIVPIQAGINSHLAKYVSHPFQAGFISFLGGFLSLFLICLVSGKMFPTISQLTNTPPHLLTGGLVGAVFVVTTIVLAPKLGATVYMTCLIGGQLLASLILDHYGMLGFSVHPINLPRILGIVLVFVGVLLVRIF